MFRRGIHILAVKEAWLLAGNYSSGLQEDVQATIRDIHGRVGTIESEVANVRDVKVDLRELHRELDNKKGIIAKQLNTHADQLKRELTAEQQDQVTLLKLKRQEQTRQVIAEQQEHWIQFYKGGSFTILAAGILLVYGAWVWANFENHLLDIEIRRRGIMSSDLDHPT
ncbi:hypothetical protein C8A03DRAFT_35351 [Achaetomium macrosporum]|uniref:Uncharacterized protein n=1 Tax=Achaetomium macrosporum TaxID=79813 RepID=A0AAN7HAV7_9PEZI|nr:hypothetical protein C8A03DRAFT_35351 [Achaetomium macrosporum]